MKKFLSLLIITNLIFLNGCSYSGAANFLLFADNFSRLYTKDTIDISDYMIKDRCYSLLLDKESSPLLLTLEENENGKIKKIRLTISKTDNMGKFKAITDSEEAEFHKAVLIAFTSFSLKSEEECRRLLSSFIPSGEAFSKEGELTTEWENFHLVFYSNGLCCQFFATDTYLEEAEATSKPVSRPLYAETANIRED